MTDEDLLSKTGPYRNMRARVAIVLLIGMAISVGCIQSFFSNSVFGLIDINLWISLSTWLVMAVVTLAMLSIIDNGSPDSMSVGSNILVVITWPLWFVIACLYMIAN